MTLYFSLYNDDHARKSKINLVADMYVFYISIKEG